MITENPLHSRDLKVSTAKAVCFRTNVQHEFEVPTPEGEKLRTVVKDILSNSEFFAVADRKDLSVAGMLEEIGHALDIMLRQVFRVDPQITDSFMQTFRAVADPCVSIDEEMRWWLESMLRYSQRYVPAPSVDLFLGAPELCDPPIADTISAFTRAVESGRLITVYLRSGPFEAHHYFELPVLLSHEFWCHSLSNIHPLETSNGGNRWKGCDPDDPWEEGWMDYIQRLILDSKDFPLPKCSSPWLLQWIQDESRKQPKSRVKTANGALRLRGERAAALVQSFFRQYYRDHEPDELLIILSLELNSVSSLPEEKSRLIDFFLRHLAAFELTTKSPKGQLIQLIDKRRALYQALETAIVRDNRDHPVSFDVNKLLTIAK